MSPYESDVVKIYKRPSENGAELRFYLQYRYDKKTWRIFTDAAGHPFASERVAKKLAAVIDYELADKVHNPFRYQTDQKNEWAFKKQITRWLATKEVNHSIEHTTYANYKRAVHQYLIPHFGMTDIKEIKGRHISDFVAAAPALSTKGALAPKSIKELVDVLAVFFNWAYRSEELIDRLPALPTIKVPEKAITAATYATQNRILELIPDRHKAIVQFAMRHGMRNGEVLALQAGDFDFEAGTITVQRQFAKGHLRAYTKTARVRILPIHPELLETVNTLCSNKLPGAWVFTIEGRPYTSQRLYKVTMKAAKLAGVKITAYQLFRHSVLTQAAMRSVDPLAIQRYAGHTSLKTTQRYLDKNAISIAAVQTSAPVLTLLEEKMNRNFSAELALAPKTST